MIFNGGIRIVKQMGGLPMKKLLIGALAAGTALCGLAAIVELHNQCKGKTNPHGARLVIAA